MILSTSATKRNIVFSIGVLIFAIIYELFSHRVYSIFMLGAFLIPLIFLLIARVAKRLNINWNFYEWAIITFTLYSIIRGILEIYGTTNSLINVYLILGVVWLSLSLIFPKKRW